MLPKTRRTLLACLTSVALALALCLVPGAATAADAATSAAPAADAGAAAALDAGDAGAEEAEEHEEGDAASAHAPPPGRPRKLKVGVAGDEPFVVTRGGDLTGVAVQIFQEVARDRRLQFDFVPVESVQEGVSAVEHGDLDLLVGDVSITADRTERMRFSQPYFQSALGIATVHTELSLMGRITPFFSSAFWYGTAILLTVLVLVGTLVWLVERKRNTEQFPERADAAARARVAPSPGANPLRATTSAAACSRSTPRTGHGRRSTTGASTAAPARHGVRVPGISRARTTRAPAAIASSMSASNKDRRAAAPRRGCSRAVPCDPPGTPGPEAFRVPAVAAETRPRGAWRERAALRRHPTLLHS